MAMKRMKPEEYSKEVSGKRWQYGFLIPAIAFATLFFIVSVVNNNPGESFIVIDMEGIITEQTSFPPITYAAGIAGMLMAVVLTVLPFVWMAIYPKKGGTRRVVTHKGQNFLIYEYDGGFDADAANIEFEKRNGIYTPKTEEEAKALGFTG